MMKTNSYPVALGVQDSIRRSNKGFRMLLTELAKARGTTRKFSCGSTAVHHLLLAGLVWLPMLGSSFAASDAPPAPIADLSVVVPAMERAQSEIQAPRQITREYHLGSPASISTDSEIVARVDFGPPGKYVIQKHFGSMRAEFVVKSVVQHELELSTSAQKMQMAAITRQNYDFQLAGTETVENHPCLILQINPKRQQPELIRGRIWVDRDSFLIRKVEGDLAKSPSWWIRNVHVNLAFSEMDGTWLQTQLHALADVRCFGSQELTSRVLDYVGPVIAREEHRRSKFTLTGGGQP